MGEGTIMADIACTGALHETLMATGLACVSEMLEAGSKEDENAKN